MIEFELDGKKIQALQGTTIIEAADAVGVYIPRFCYHKKLSVAANCRMCLVEVEKAPKPLPACATLITPNMTVKTKSDMAQKAQRDVMEFLLINHPLDCPICDQGGECELQDLSLGFGSSKSVYQESKRAVFSQDIGPLIETEMTRCIQCTRCVRFGEEVAGLRELGVLCRGEKEEIGTYVQHFLKSEMSGNIIDLCPVGALTNKPARYAVRGWEVTEHASISAQDCVGTNLYLHSRVDTEIPEKTIFRAVPRENEAINETWMSDRDRFCVAGLYHEDRIYKPLMKKNGDWVEVEWRYALDAIAHLTLHIQKEYGTDQIAGIAGYSSTVEEYYLFQKMIRALGSPHVDHRIRESDFRDQMRRPLFPQLNLPMADIEQCDAILLIGSNIRFEQPIISTRIFKATQECLQVMAVNIEDYPFVFSLSEKIIDQNMVQSLAEIAKALAEKKQEKIAGLDNIAPSQPAMAIAEKLSQAERGSIFLGAIAHHHPHASLIRDLVHHIANLSGATAGLLTDGANAAGAWIAGCIPHRTTAGAAVSVMGEDAKALLTSDPVAAYFVLDTELEHDALYAQAALDNLSQAKLVVCFNTFVTEKMKEYADFILPIAPFSENAGTYVNAAGTWQSFESAGVPHGQSRPAWKVLRVLANGFNLPGFAYETVTQISDVVRAQINQDQCCDDCKKCVDIVLPAFDKEMGVKTWKIYQDNALVRRAKPLQAVLA